MNVHFMNLISYMRSNIPVLPCIVHLLAVHMCIEDLAVWNFFLQNVLCATFIETYC